MRPKRAIAVVPLLFALAFGLIVVFVARFYDGSIKHVKIKNDFVYIAPAALAQELKQVKLGNFFLINVGAIKGVLKKDNPWIDDILVKKVWPDSLEIFITEKKPLGSFNDIAVMTTQCEVIHPAERYIADVSFVGPETSALKLCEFFSNFNVKLAKENLVIKKLVIDKNNSWVMLLNNNIKIILGTKNIDDKAMSFLRYYNSIIKKYPAVNYIDMRYNHAIAINVQTNFI